MKAHAMEVQEALSALRRAALLARKTAVDTDTWLVVMKNGKVVHIPAQQLRQQAQAESAEKAR